MCKFKLHYGARFTTNIYASRSGQCMQLAWFLLQISTALWPRIVRECMSMICRILMFHWSESNYFPNLPAVLNNIDPPHRKIFSLPIIIVACTAWSSDYPLDGSLSVNCRKMDYNQHQLWPITRRMSPVFYNDFHPIPVSKNCKWQWRIMNEWASYNWMKRPLCFASS